MSHRKVYSHGSIPFSWEDSPGVRKAGPPCHDQPHRAASPWDDAVVTLGSTIPDNSVPQKFAIPPPPHMAGVPRRTSSGKGFWPGQESDPFLAAYKECTKDAGTVPEPLGRSKKPSLKFGARKSTAAFLFSCKSSGGDVREDSFVRLSQLPPLPRGRMTRATR